MGASDWIFGYGSLVDEYPPSDSPQPIGASWARLRGFRRAWNVAMSNADPRNDRKHYVDLETAERPDIQVAFANLRESPSDRCIGVLIPTPPGSPGLFDEREVNYRRIEVTELLEPRPRGRAWTYVGLDAARERYERGRRAGAAYVAREYAEAVEAGFRRAGGPIHREFLDSTDPIGLPTRPLRLVLRR